MTLRILFLSLIFTNSTARIKEPQNFYLEDRSVNLYAFIGEKISFEEFDLNKNSTRITINPVTKDTIKHVSLITDNAYKVKYRIIKPIFNDLKVDTIDFIAYDHYGRPGFEKSKNVILYISKSEKGEYYVHQKYQYDPVVQIRKGSWKGENGKSIEKLFNAKKEGVFKARGIINLEKNLTTTCKRLLRPTASPSFTQVRWWPYKKTDKKTLILNCDKSNTK